jgi:L-rhamnose mutarotase
MTDLRRYVLALDLRDDADLIAEYEANHQPDNVWPEILASIRASGIRDMTIYRRGTRLVMIMEVDATFSFTAKAAADAVNPAVARWEDLMWRYQQPLPGSPPGTKWQLMEPIFALSEHGKQRP